MSGHDGCHGQFCSCHCCWICSVVVGLCHRGTFLNDYPGVVLRYIPSTMPCGHNVCIPMLDPSQIYLNSTKAWPPRYSIPVGPISMKSKHLMLWCSDGTHTWHEILRDVTGAQSESTMCMTFMHWSVSVQENKTEVHPCYVSSLQLSLFGPLLTLYRESGVVLSQLQVTCCDYRVHARTTQICCNLQN